MPEQHPDAGSLPDHHRLRGPDMSRHRAFPIYVAEHCGHQHSTQDAAENCARNQLQHPGMDYTFVDVLRVHADGREKRASRVTVDKP